MPSSNEPSPSTTHQYTVNGHPVELTEWLENLDRAYAINDFDILVDEPRTRFFNLGPYPLILHTTPRRLGLFTTLNLIRYMIFLVAWPIIIHIIVTILLSCGISLKVIGAMMVLAMGRTWLWLLLEWGTMVIWLPHIDRSAKVAFVVLILLSGMVIWLAAREVAIPML
ncbi:hypothetical protein SBOR_5210 [Sclerotinia borealis F-4128]|uniref:Uncharacterized protein n=1 Tax=Sclerotinia borealis (strain F-4128) TaxID=1432307 RepID=W9CCE6_SCLBF|nr:hypothetical protein SBOR_5210 [Sclerotinia borealis F-4128]